MMRVHSELERRAAEYTLRAVMAKLEEALRLARECEASASAVHSSVHAHGKTRAHA